MTIYLPSDEELTIDIRIKIDNKKSKTFTVDLIDLENEFILANRKAKELDTDWTEEFGPLAKRLFDGFVVSRGQAGLLWNAVQAKLDEIKKKLQGPSDSSSTTDSKSSRKRKKK